MIAVDAETEKILVKWASDWGVATPEELLRKAASEYAQSCMKNVARNAKEVVSGVGKTAGIADEQSGMTPLQLVEESVEEATLADGFEDALIGIVEWFGHPPVALYNREKCIAILMERDGMDWEEAEEFFGFNVIGSYVGESTPAFATIVPSGL